MNNRRITKMSMSTLALLISYFFVVAHAAEAPLQKHLLPKRSRAKLQFLSIAVLLIGQWTW